MKCKFYSLLVSLAAGLLVAQAGWAQTATAAPVTPTLTTDPLKIALLHWYKANLAISFAVGNQPYGVAFDGADIWGANYGDGTVSKIQTNEG
ncbi:MAG TPA: hypothetical protein VND65_16885, partial [Candidatus Binatia bacterium]|nr:hypothetical protein [Candidatus Binatia bacterium]